MDRLQQILSTMEVPESRKGDLRWLNRNLGIQNRDHPDLHEACTIIRATLVHGSR